MTKLMGEATSSSATMEGSATGAPYGNGRVSIVESTGRRCEGTYRHVSRAKGFGTLTCDDGTTGIFQFDTSGSAGGGTAILGEDEYRFRFRSA